MQDERTVMLSTSMGQSVEIPLVFDGERESAEIRINGAPYHFERIHSSLLLSEYRIDNVRIIGRLQIPMGTATSLHHFRNNRITGPDIFVAHECKTNLSRIYSICPGFILRWGLIRGDRELVERVVKG
jgi:hypothetical protein